MSEDKKIKRPPKCPICSKPVAVRDEDFPFCSDRCRILDLGKWARGEYRISSPILDPEVLEGLGEQQRRPGGGDDNE